MATLPSSSLNLTESHAYKAIQRMDQYFQSYEDKTSKDYLQRIEDWKRSLQEMANGEVPAKPTGFRTFLRSTRYLDHHAVLRSALEELSPDEIKAVAQRYATHTSLERTILPILPAQAAVSTNTEPSLLQSGNITIFIRFLTGESLPVTAPISGTVKDLREDIFRSTGLSSENYKLITAGEVLEDSHLVQGLQQVACVHLVMGRNQDQKKRYEECLNQPDQEIVWEMLYLNNTPGSKEDPFTLNRDAVMVAPSVEKARALFETRKTTRSANQIPYIAATLRPKDWQNPMYSMEGDDRKGNPAIWLSTDGSPVTRPVLAVYTSKDLLGQGETDLIEIPYRWAVKSPYLIQARQAFFAPTAPMITDEEKPLAPPSPVVTYANDQLNMAVVGDDATSATLSDLQALADAVISACREGLGSAATDINRNIQARSALLPDSVQEAYENIMTTMMCASGFLGVSSGDCRTQTSTYFSALRTENFTEFFAPTAPSAPLAVAGGGSSDEGPTLALSFFRAGALVVPPPSAPVPSHHHYQFTLKEGVTRGPASAGAGGGLSLPEALIIDFGGVLEGRICIEDFNSEKESKTTEFNAISRQTIEGLMALQAQGVKLYSGSHDSFADQYSRIKEIQESYSDFQLDAALRLPTEILERLGPQKEKVCRGPVIAAARTSEGKQALRQAYQDAGMISEPSRCVVMDDAPTVITQAKAEGYQVTSFENAPDPSSIFETYISQFFEVTELPRTHEHRAHFSCTPRE